MSVNGSISIQSSAVLGKNPLLMMLADSYFEDPQNFIKIRPLRSFEQYLEDEK
jgi:hypothetical protein